MPMTPERREQWRDRMSMPADADPVQVQILEELRLARRQRQRRTSFSITRVLLGVLVVCALFIFWPAAIVLLILIVIMSLRK